MKLNTTVKEIKANANRIVSVGYCEAQNLLKYQRPFAYTSGVYGWNADYYMLEGGIVLATGYRSMPQDRGVKCDYKTVRAFDNRAAKAKDSKEIAAILGEFVKAITV